MNFLQCHDRPRTFQFSSTTPPRFGSPFFLRFSRHSTADVTGGRLSIPNANVSFSPLQEQLIIWLITPHRSLTMRMDVLILEGEKSQLFCLPARSEAWCGVCTHFCVRTVLLEMRYFALRYNNCYSVSAKCNLFTKSRSFYYSSLVLRCCCCCSIQ